MTQSITWARTLRRLGFALEGDRLYAEIGLVGLSILLLSLFVLR